jgi:cytidyltransferase-like protein
MKERVALYPGSFDPITLGHIDILERATAIFDRVVVSVLRNPAKQPTFSVDERLELIRAATQPLDGEVTVDSFDGLTVEHARQVGAIAVVQPGEGGLPARRRHQRVRPAGDRRGPAPAPRDAGMSGGPPDELPPSTLDLLDALDSLLADARRVPFSGSVVVNDEQLMQLVDRIRLSIPGEVVRAQELLEERERLLRDTREHVEGVAERAETAARELGGRVEAQARELAQRAQEAAAQLGERAQAEAQRRVEEAQAQAERLVSDHAVLRAAQERAALLVREAAESAAKITGDAEAYARDADDYVRSVMADLEERLTTAAETVRKGLTTLATPAAPRKKHRGEPRA